MTGPVAPAMVASRSRAAAGLGPPGAWEGSPIDKASGTVAAAQATKPSPTRREGRRCGVVPRGSQIGWWLEAAKQFVDVRLAGAGKVVSHRAHLSVGWGAVDAGEE